MSSIQTVPVEILLDVFRADDPAAVEALQLTCRRFYSIIPQNVDTLPTRLVCDLVYCASGAQLYRDNENLGRDNLGRWRREPVTSGDSTPSGLRQLYEAFVRNTSIRTVDVRIAYDHRRKRYSGADALLMQLIDDFLSVKSAARLEIRCIAFLPNAAVLDRFERLETIRIETSIREENWSFWRVVFATKAYRRVPTVIIVNSERHGDRYPDVDDGALFDFITDFSLVPAGKPRVVLLGALDDDSLDAFERRFYKNINSIDGQVCAYINGSERRYITNMAFGSRKKVLALQLVRAASLVVEV